MLGGEGDGGCNGSEREGGLDGGWDYGCVNFKLAYCRTFYGCSKGAFFLKGAFDRC